MPAQHPRSPLVRRFVSIGVLAGLLLVLLISVVAVQRVISLKHRIDRVQALVSGNGSSSLSIEMFGALRRELNGGIADIRALEAIASPILPVFGRLGGLPGIGPTLQAVPHLVAMGDHFLSAADCLFDGLTPLAGAVLGNEQNGSQQSPGVTERLLPPLLAAQPRFVEAQDFIERATAEREQIPRVGVLPVLARQLNRLDKYLPSLRSASQLATIAPILLGAVRPMRYLLIAQNNDELRPTGGFMTAIGQLVLDKGKITSLTIQNSYSADTWKRDHPAPPPPLTRYMGAELWVIRDSNFWPDFPTSARAAAFFTDLDLDYVPDGVIAVDQIALQTLVGGMGGVVVPEFNNDILTGDNTIAKIHSYWEPPPALIEEDEKAFIAWYAEHKQFMTYLIQAMRQKLEADTRSLNPIRFGKAVLQTLNEKHILIYLNDPLGGGLAEGANWGGVLKNVTGDYLAVVDTNMGFNKVNAIVRRSIDYAVTVDAAGLARSQVTVSYENPSTRQVECIQESYFEASYDLMINRCYFNYLRVYIPNGSTVIAGDDGIGSMENAGIEAGKQVWAQWMVIPPQGRQQFSLHYYLPGPVLQQVGDRSEYRLFVQKQAGTDRTPLHVTVTLPVGTRVLGASPGATSITGNAVQFESDLATDQEFWVIIK